MEEEKEIRIDGVKLIGWPAEIVRSHEKLKKDYQTLFSGIADLGKRIAKAEGSIKKLNEIIRNL